MSARVHTLVNGPLEQNCYALQAEGRSDCILVDPGSDAAGLQARLEALGLQPALLIATHGHYDHVGAVHGLAAPLGGLAGHGPEFRQTCLKELRQARKQGLLAGTVEPRRLAEQAGAFARFHDPAGVLDAEWQAEAERLAADLGVSLVGRSRGQRLVIGRDYVEEEMTVAGRTFRYRQPEGAFTQPNGTVCQKMLQWAHDALGERQDDLLELYCGNGNFTLPLSTRVRKVLATEISKTSVNAALANLAGNRWCGVDYQTFESSVHKDIHVLGDAIQIAPAMPKSGHMANSHGKVAAAATQRASTAMVQRLRLRSVNVLTGPTAKCPTGWR